MYFVELLNFWTITTKW